MKYAEAGGLRIARSLHDFVVQEAMPGTGVEATCFWDGLGGLIREFAPRNKALLAKRDALQAHIDDWHRRHRKFDLTSYVQFLRRIDYLVPEPPNVTVGTANVDPEITSTAGPQLVVPVTNARYALNAANARWGSLYDALYGTDALPRDVGVTPKTGGAGRGGLDETRVKRVAARAREILDQAAPLKEASYAAAGGFPITEGVRKQAPLIYLQVNA
jgi:malate synthase